MTRKATSMRTWVLTAAVAVVALAGASMAYGATSSTAATTSSVTKGDLTEKLSWTGQLAYANAASLTYKSGQATAGAHPTSVVSLASATIATKVATFNVAFGSTATPAPSPSPSPSPSPTHTPSPSPSPSPTHTPSPSPSPTHTPSPSPSPTHTPSPSPSPTRGGS